MQARTAREPFRTRSVTNVSGIKRNLCVRNGPPASPLGCQDSNLRMAESKSAALPMISAREILGSSFLCATLALDTIARAQRRRLWDWIEDSQVEHSQIARSSLDPGASCG